MADPKGKLVTPVAFNPSGYPLALEVDANGYLKVATASAGNFLVGTHGYVNGAWQKNPIQFGYSAGLYWRINNYSLAADANDLNTGTVPAGWIWVVTHICLYYGGTSPASISSFLIHSSITYLINRVWRPINDRYYDKQGWWVLEAGDYMRMTIYGATAGDSAIFTITGFKVQLVA
jgi:hypothetical protein